MKYRIWYYKGNKRVLKTVEVASPQELKAELAKLPPGSVVKVGQSSRSEDGRE